MANNELMNIAAVLSGNLENVPDGMRATAEALVQYQEEGVGKTTLARAFSGAVIHAVQGVDTSNKELGKILAIAETAATPFWKELDCKSAASFFEKVTGRTEAVFHAAKWYAKMVSIPAAYGDADMAAIDAMGIGAPTMYEIRKATHNDLVLLCNSHFLRRAVTAKSMRACGKLLSEHYKGERLKSKSNPQYITQEFAVRVVESMGEQGVTAADIAYTKTDGTVSDMPVSSGLILSRLANLYQGKEPDAAEPTTEPTAEPTAETVEETVAEPDASGGAVVINLYHVMYGDRIYRVVPGTEIGAITEALYKRGFLPGYTSPATGAMVLERPGKGCSDISGPAVIVNKPHTYTEDSIEAYRTDRINETASMIACGQIAPTDGASRLAQLSTMAPRDIASDIMKSEGWDYDYTDRPEDIACP